MILPTLILNGPNFISLCSQPQGRGKQPGHQSLVGSGNGRPFGRHILSTLGAAKPSRAMPGKPSCGRQGGCMRGGRIRVGHTSDGVYAHLFANLRLFCTYAKCVKWIHTNAFQKKMETTPKHDLEQACCIPSMGFLKPEGTRPLGGSSRSAPFSSRAGLRHPPRGIR